HDRHGTHRARSGQGAGACAVRRGRDPCLPQRPDPAQLRYEHGALHAAALVDRGRGGRGDGAAAREPRRGPARRGRSVMRAMTCLLALSLALQARAEVAADRVGPADLARIADVSEPEFSPGGEYVAYTLTTTNPGADK